VRGVRATTAASNADDPNDVVVLQDVSDMKRAQLWAGSDDLKSGMQKSGVVGAPSVRFAD
jgi:hypothetical protein